jgi:hypothetical protein
MNNVYNKNTGSLYVPTVMPAQSLPATPPDNKDKAGNKPYNHKAQGASSSSINSLKVISFTQTIIKQMLGEKSIEPSILNYFLLRLFHVYPHMSNIYMALHTLHLLQKLIDCLDDSIIASDDSQLKTTMENPLMLTPLPTIIACYALAESSLCDNHIRTSDYIKIASPFLPADCTSVTQLNSVKREILRYIDYDVGLGEEDMRNWAVSLVPFLPN